ncbi:MAG: hypothetical protein ACYC0X_23595 [Pirellulaceae bacterium]
MAKKTAKKPTPPAKKKRNTASKPTSGNCYQLAATAFLGLLGTEHWQDTLGPWLEQQGIEPRNIELVHAFRTSQPKRVGGASDTHGLNAAIRER